jgi:hypothetical protein
MIIIIFAKKKEEEQQMVRAMVLVMGLIMSLTAAGTAFAAHPLITDDAGTLGKGKAQLEFTGEYGIEKENGVTEKSLEAPTTPFLSFGLSENTDLVFGLPFVSVRVDDAGTTTAVRGATDMSIELKARLKRTD